MYPTNKNLGYYCQKLSRLNVNRSRDRGIAPHKPILLLSVIDLIERSVLRHNQIFLDPELIATFLKFWSLLGSDAHQADIALPFFHLRGDGFWHFKANPGYESVISSKSKLRNINALQEVVHHVYLDDELFKYLQDVRSRQDLVNALVAAWFSEKADYVKNLWQVDALQDISNQLQKEGGAVYQPEELKDEARTVVRDAAFRRVIVSIYEFRCAFCELQVIDALGQNIVDGAHIKPFSQFYDDRIDNGISLCKNHHWGFDRGWFAVQDDYTLVVSESLREDSPHSTPMRAFNGDRIRLPVQQQYYPRIEALRWHRENVFAN